MNLHCCKNTRNDNLNNNLEFPPIEIEVSIYLIKLKILTKELVRDEFVLVYFEINSAITNGECLQLPDGWQYIDVVIVSLVIF